MTDEQLFSDISKLLADKSCTLETVLLVGELKDRYKALQFRFSELEKDRDNWRRQVLEEDACLNYVHEQFKKKGIDYLRQVKEIVIEPLNPFRLKDALFWGVDWAKVNTSDYTQTNEAK